MPEYLLTFPDCLYSSPPCICQHDQPCVQFIWLFQVPNFRVQCIFTGSQPPPTPSPNASTQPRNLGSPMTNSFIVVGSCAASFSNVLQSRNDCFLVRKYFHQTIHSFTYRIFKIGVINFFPVGTAVAACRIFQSIF